MNKKDAIKLLEFQTKRINCSKLNREEWLVSTNAVLLKVFPLSAKSKIAQLARIQHISADLRSLSNDQQVSIRKNRAESYLKNHIEEIEFLGLESSTDNLSGLFKSIWFWAVLVSASTISFVAGNATDELLTPKSYPFSEFKNQIEHKENQIDSVRKELRIFGESI